MVHIRADLLIMGTHGRGGFERLFLGSVTEKVLRTARCPVLTVPPPPAERAPSRPVLYKTILCPLDFSDASMRALECALSLAKETHAQARVILLHVLLPLIQVAEETGTDLIVMGVHGEGVLDRWLFGSTTHHVIREVACPALTLRA